MKLRIAANNCCAINRRLTLQNTIDLQIEAAQLRQADRETSASSSVNRGACSGVVRLWRSARDGRRHSLVAKLVNGLRAVLNRLRIALLRLLLVIVLSRRVLWLLLELLLLVHLLLRLILLLLILWLVGLLAKLRMLLKLRLLLWRVSLLRILILRLRLLLRLSLLHLSVGRR